MATRGPKKIELNKDEFEGLCRLQCTREEICGWFHVDHKTLDRWCRDTYHQKYSPVYKEMAQAGRISLRRAQFRMAEKSAVMAIFLGKQYLGQSDTMTQTITDEMSEKLDKIAGSIADHGGNEK